MKLLHTKKVEQKWFLLALVLSGLFIILTAIYAMHILDMPTLSVESWLLHRPVSKMDCVFFEWRNMGEVPESLFLILVLGVICWRAGYSWKIIPVLLALVLFCAGIEYIGKKVFILHLPRNLLSAVTDLSCPQIRQEPISVRWETVFGLWWQIPAPVAEQVHWIRTVAQMPLASMPISAFTDTDRMRSYPGGHATRWCFLGLIACWLCWKHIRQRVGRMVLIVFFCLLAFFGGFMQFYIGVHTLTDTIAGYLLGSAAACCAIGFLNIFDRNKLVSINI